MRKSYLFRSFFVVISAIWLFMMVLLIQRSVETRREPLKEFLPYAESDSTEWMSIYLSDQKIGYIVSMTRETETGYLGTESSYMRFSLSGTDQDMKTFVRAQSDKDYSLQSFTFEIRSRHQLLRAKGNVVGKALQVQLNSGGEIQDLSFTLPEDAYMPFSIAPLIEEKELEEGESLSITVFDPSAFQPTEMWIKHLGVQRIKHRGEARETTHLSVAFFGTRMDMWVDETGRALRQEGPMGLLIVEEPREMAERFPHAERPVELLTLFSIPTQEEIANPRSVTYLRVELEGAELDPGDISNNRQKILSTSPLQIEIRAIEPGSSPRTDTSVDYGEYLSSEPLLQADHPEIRATSSSIVKEETDPWKKSQAIADWVNSSLKKSPTVSLPSALDVLTAKRGDCNEHAVLVAALLRAAGIPAVIATGVVYLDGSFYYHAWNRAYVGQWIDIDATFGQHIADATHLLLAEGGIENQASMANIIGRLNIKIRKYR